MLNGGGGKTHTRHNKASESGTRGMRGSKPAGFSGVGERQVRMLLPCPRNLELPPFYLPLHVTTRIWVIVCRRALGCEWGGKAHMARQARVRDVRDARLEAGWVQRTRHARAQVLHRQIKSGVSSDQTVATVRRDSTVSITRHHPRSYHSPAAPLP